MSPALFSFIVFLVAMAVLYGISWRLERREARRFLQRTIGAIRGLGAAFYHLAPAMVRGADAFRALGAALAALRCPGCKGRGEWCGSQECPGDGPGPGVFPHSDEHGGSHYHEMICGTCKGTGFKEQETLEDVRYGAFRVEGRG